MADGLTTFIDRRPVDVDLAQQQWRDYVAAFADRGWQIREIEPDDACPDSVFIEDAAFVWKSAAVIARPGAPSRRPEVPPVAAVLAEADHESFMIESPGTLDGGDVLKIGDDVYIGLGGRTNRDAIDQVTRFLEPLGASVHAVPSDAVLHLKSAVTALPDGVVIGWAPVTPAEGLPPVFAMPEEAGAHVVDLGGGDVLISAGAPRSAELIAGRGFNPVPIDISEYEKLEGCVTCLSIRLRDSE